MDNFSIRWLEAGKNCCGNVIGHVDGGYFLNLKAMPADSENPRHPLESSSDYRKIATEAMHEVIEHFREQIQALPAEDLRRPSILKQFLRSCIRISTFSSHYSVLLTTQIGQTKWSSLFLLSQDLDKEDLHAYLGFLDWNKVAGMSMHLGCNVRAKDEKTHLMWSRYGLQAVSAHREIG